MSEKKEQESQLLQARKVVKASLTRISTFIVNFRPATHDILQIQLRNSKIDEIWVKYESIQATLEELDLEAHEEDREEFENNYYRIKTELEKLIQSKQQVLNQINLPEIHSTKVKLPQITIPSFSGKYDQWNSFHDIFTSMIHENNHISDIEKFYYLKSALKDEALQVIESVSASAENYQVARELLIERYDNNQFIINAHLKSFFDLPSVGRDCVTGLRKLINDAKQHLRSLESLKLPVQHWDMIIIFIIKQKLDAASRREWELKREANQLPTLKELYKFLERRCFSLESIGTHEKTNEKPKHFRTAVHLASDSSKGNTICKLCKANHSLYQCNAFLQKQINARISAVKTTGVCFNCLRSGHGVKNCKSRSCGKCGKRHNTLLHIEQTGIQQEEEKLVPVLETTPSVFSISKNQSQILLATAIVQIQDRHENWISCRALLDSASQSNFIKNSLVKRLGYNTKSTSFPVNGINQTQTTITKLVDLKIKSSVNNYKKNLQFLVLPSITIELPSQYIPCSNWSLPTIPLADPRFNEPREVELLIGAEIYFEILRNNQIKLGRGLPVLQSTMFGWIISGAIKGKQIEKNTNCYLTTTPDLNEQISNFWELEEFPGKRFYSKEEQKCENHFTENTTRSKTGNFVVMLPFKENKHQLGLSYDIALKRLKNLEDKLNNDEKLKHEYQLFLREYLELGHMQKVLHDDISTGYYLPHHAVVKNSSLSTKLRVVFDASAKTSSKLSLNDTLMVGATIQNDLVTILLRFRCYKYVLTADIEKMYRQVNVHKDDIKYQKILWRENPNEIIQAYYLKTVTYGMSPAPFLAIRCLLQLAHEEHANFPDACETIKNEFYVDDLLTGAHSIEGAIQKRDELIALLTKGGFKLRKWMSNRYDLVSSLASTSSDPLLILDPTKTVKTLGMTWDAQNDTIRYVVNETTEDNVTKRQILSQIARLFDPLGLLGPVVVKAKLIMQELWQLKSDWDTIVPKEIYQRWQEFQSHLPSLNDLIIQRKTIIDDAVRVELHAFGDASELAYGACIYIISTNVHNVHMTRLVCAKSRVAPLKKISLPRLELCAAVLTARLFEAIENSFNFTINGKYFWSDSTITLYWIKTEPCKLKTFIANRVAEIQRLTNTNDWRHVNSRENPADVLSRGRSPQQMHDEHLWWNGPLWITKTNTLQIDNIIFDNLPKETLEFKSVQISTHIACANKLHIFESFSSLQKLKRITAFCIRFANNSRVTKDLREIGPLTVTEINNAQDALIRAAQEQAYHKEICDLKEKRELERRSSLKTLNPFLDKFQILRVGGRLQNSELSYSQKHPIILPAKHTLTRLILKHEHEVLLHAGNQAVLASIRQRYWPINGRNVLKNLIQRCFKCFRFRARAQTQLMGNLPAARVKMSRPFLNTGIDYGGPLFIKKNRNTFTKAYIALFVCMATKAIHLELVSSLSTSDFIAALRRFISRRGRCSNIYSDNGTNFHGANNLLIDLQIYLAKQCNQRELKEAASSEEIQWHFIPPGAPNFGGLWEAGIKSVKYHIKRVIGETRLTFEETYTLLTQIEACVNSRPLIPLHDDPNDLSILTPSHFLIGEQMTVLVDRDHTDTPVNRLTRWQLIQQQQQNFWKKWSSEYLHQLQQRTKWSSETRNLTKGDLVLLKDEKMPPLQWKVARVQEVHPGSDGRVRVVTILTSSGLLKRPITKLCLLPAEEKIVETVFQGGRNVEDEESARPLVEVSGDPQN